MRHDARIDRKQVKLPNADLSGYGKWKAQFGDMVLYAPNPDYPSCGKLARIAGRIAHALALEPNEQPIKNWLLVLAFSDDMTYVYERWIKPESVIKCWTPQIRHVDLLECMLTRDFKKQTPNELREFAESGFATFDDWKAYKEKSN